MAFQCSVCNAEFKEMKNLNRHVRSLHETAPALFRCTQCEKTFNRKDNLNVHLLTHSRERSHRTCRTSADTKVLPSVYVCARCGTKISLRNNFIRHLKLRCPIQKNDKSRPPQRVSAVPPPSAPIAQPSSSSSSSPLPPPPPSSRPMPLSIPLISHATKSKTTFTCDYCNKKFNRRDNMLRHKWIHLEYNATVSGGGTKTFSGERESPPENNQQQQQHQEQEGVQQEEQEGREQESDRDVYVARLVTSSFNGRLKTFCVENSRPVDPENFLADAKQTIVKTITKEVAKRSIKFNMVLITMFGKTSEDGTPIETEIYSQTKQQVVDRTSDIEELYDKAVDRILNLVSEFDDRGSGWAFRKVLCLELRVTRYVPLGGGSYTE